MVRIDMSEYMEKFSVQRLIGAPPGYVGYDEGGQLTEAVRRKPYSVILLDEIEKAHPDVFNILLQVLDDGRLTDGQGRVVSFTNAIIIMTSNVGSQYIRDFEESGERRREAAMEAKPSTVRFVQTFRPEFLNRIDDIVTFKALTMDEHRAYRGAAIGGCAQASGASVASPWKWVPALWSNLCIEGYDPVYGARPLKRLIQRNVVDTIATAIVSGQLHDGDNVKVDFDMATGEYTCERTDRTSDDVNAFLNSGEGELPAAEE